MPSFLFLPIKRPRQDPKAHIPQRFAVSENQRHAFPSSALISLNPDVLAKVHTVCQQGLQRFPFPDHSTAAALGFSCVNSR